MGHKVTEWQISTTQGGDRYSESTGTYNTGVDLAGVTVADQTYNGDWVQVSLPRKIKVDHMNFSYTSHLRRFAYARTRCSSRIE